MQYCPKCQQTYEDEAQRFCLSDGARLVPASNSAKSSAGTNGVFTNIIGKPTAINKSEDEFASIPHFVKTEIPAEPHFHNRNEQTGARDEDDFELELAPVSISHDDIDSELELDDFEPLPTQVKPARIIKPNEVPSGTADIGDRRTNPTGRTAFSRENPSVLLGQTIKGRYLLAEIYEEDETGVSYLAEDKINPPKKALITVLTDEEPDDTFDDFFEERISLAHVNHPNIARVIDSGELPEGMPFIVSEYIEANSVRDLLKKSAQINPMRAARIVRQAAYALSEVHQNAILHRDLKPENILLTVSESGAEQIKLINFGTSSGKLHKRNLAYKAPEVLERKPSTFSGDIYSLAVIAYQMLTNRLPFQGGSEKELLKSQRQGLLLVPTNLRLDVPPSIDKILEKALAFNPAARYPKARDFGDAFFNALTTTTLQVEESKESLTPEKNDLLETYNELEIPKPKDPLVFSEAKNAENEILDLEDNKAETGKNDERGFETAKIGTAKIETAEPASFVSNTENVDISDIENRPEETVVTNEIKAQEDLWARRSPEPPITANRNWMLFSLLGLAALLAGVWAIWSYSLKQQNEPEFTAQTQNAEQSQQPQLPVASNPNESTSPGASEIEVPPLPRQISQPSDTVYFQSSKQNLKGDLLRNYLPFSVYYPNDWQKNAVKESDKAGVRGKFLDISKNAPNGVLSEQMLVSYYDSRGVYKDDVERFPQLVKETNETLKKLIPNYQMLSETETVINGWKAYEVKFQGGGTTSSGEKMIVWGRRLFIPPMRAGFKSGYEITLLATSLSPEVKSVDDVGTKGDLATVLETFEPDQNF